MGAETKEAQIELRQICENCYSYLLDELIDVRVEYENGNNDENELNNYDYKTISVCCVCVAHQRVKGMVRVLNL